jgi:hypothetical protein
MLNIQVMQYIKYLYTYLFVNFHIIINHILCFLDYVRIYDIEKGIDITIIYYLIKHLLIIDDMKYSKIGVCKYVNNKYVRYICYDTKLSDIRNIKLCASKYFDIKKIEIKTSDSYKYDITLAKNNFYNTVDHHNIDIRDIVRFYQIINNLYFKNEISICVSKEFFDDDSLEFIKMYDEMYIR